MKQRIHNTYKGKILVTGNPKTDINKLKDNEIMLYRDNSNNEIRVTSKNKGKKENYKLEENKLQKKTRIETSFEGTPIYPIYIYDLSAYSSIEEISDGYLLGTLKVLTSKDAFIKHQKLYILLYVPNTDFYREDRYDYILSIKISIMNRNKEIHSFYVSNMEVNYMYSEGLSYLIIELDLSKIDRSKLYDDDYIDKINNEYLITHKYCVSNRYFEGNIEGISYLKYLDRNSFFFSPQLKTYITFYGYDELPLNKLHTFYMFKGLIGYKQLRTLYKNSSQRLYLYNPIKKFNRNKVIKHSLKINYVNEYRDDYFTFCSYFEEFLTKKLNTSIHNYPFLRKLGIMHNTICNISSSLDYNTEKINSINYTCNTFTCIKSDIINHFYLVRYSYITVISSN